LTGERGRERKLTEGVRTVERKAPNVPEHETKEREREEKKEDRSNRKVKYGWRVNAVQVLLLVQLCSFVSACFVKPPQRRAWRIVGLG
jgi:hypothetical protein